MLSVQMMASKIVFICFPTRVDITQVLIRVRVIKDKNFRIFDVFTTMASKRPTVVSFGAIKVESLGTSYNI